VSWLWGSGEGHLRQAKIHHWACADGYAKLIQCMRKHHKALDHQSIGRTGGDIDE
jgi:hypothetical protein